MLLDTLNKLLQLGVSVWDGVCDVYILILLLEVVLELHLVVLNWGKDKTDSFNFNTGFILV